MGVLTASTSHLMEVCLSLEAMISNLSSGTGREGQARPL